MTSPRRSRDKHLEARRRRVIEMRHHRQPDLLGDLDRHVERGDPGIAAGAAPDPHLDPDDQVAVGVDDPDAFARVDEAQIGRLADHHRGGERKDPGKRHVEVGQDAQRRRLDDVPAKAVEIAGAGAARIDEGRRAAALRDSGGVDPERGPAPIDMGVQVDQPGHDDEAARIDDFRPRQRQAGADGDDLAGAKPDIGDRVAPVRRIDDPAALEDHIQHRPPRQIRGRASPGHPRLFGPQHARFQGVDARPARAWGFSVKARTKDARGGGGPSPEGALRRQPPPKLLLAPSPRCRVSGSQILGRAARCLNMLLPVDA